MCAPFVEGMMTVYIILRGEACAFLMTNHEKKQTWALLPKTGEEGFVVLCSPAPLTTNEAA